MKTVEKIKAEITETENQRLQIVGLQGLKSANVRELIDINNTLTEKIKKLNIELKQAEQ